MSTLPPSNISIFRFATEFEQFPAGQTIFREGDAGDQMFVVKEGEVDIVVQGRVVETIGQGGIFGEMALIDHQPRSGSAVTRVDSQLVRVDERRFQSLVERTPFFALEVMRIMAHRLRRMNARA